MEEKANNSPEWLEANTILMTVSGSRAYGTNTEDSDKDYRGVCVPPVEYYLGLDSFSEYNSSTGGNYKNTKDDTDITIQHVNKFVHGLIKGVPQNIEMLFTREEDIVTNTYSGLQLIKNRHLFLTKAGLNPTKGFARSEQKRMFKSLLENGEYDYKAFYQATRLLYSALEILQTCNYSTYRPKEEREYLILAKTGKITYDDAIEKLKELEMALAELELEGRVVIPDKPDYNKINILLININKSSLGL